MGRKQLQLLWIYSLEKYLKTGTEFGCVMLVANKDIWWHVLRGPNSYLSCTILVFLGEIRCYCDAAHCVATGYMCKSELSACFSRLLDPQNTHSPLTHGCLDSIASTAEICQAKQAQNHSGTTTVSTLECCHEDMCNYRGLHDVLSPSRGDASGRAIKLQWNPSSGHQASNSQNLVHLLLLI